MSWGADWPDGFGFLQQIVDSRVIRPAGNTNLGIKLPEVDKLIDQALTENDMTKREAIWGQIDKTVMEQAAGDPRCLAQVAALPPRHDLPTCSSTTATPTTTTRRRASPSRDPRARPRPTGPTSIGK